MQQQLARVGACMRAGKWREAAGILKTLRGRHPREPELMRLAGVVAYKLGDNKRALDSLQSALAHHRDPALVHTNIGSVLRGAGQSGASRRHFETALEHNPDFEPAWYNLGLLHQQQARPEEARRCFENAVERRPNRVDGWLCLGHARKALGDIDEAAAAYRRGLDLQPGSGDLWWSLANIKTVAFSPEEVEKMRAAANKADEAGQMPGVHFALAKALEDEGAYAGAFEQLRIGNSLQRRRVQYDAVAKQRLGERIRKAFDHELMSRLAGTGDDSYAPIFIVSLPRSGSTLVEQILSSHSEITGASELPDLGEVALSALADDEPGGWSPERIRDLGAGQFRELGAEYLRRTRRWQQTVHFTDKMPNNFPLVGLIGLILPGARIINVRRDPRDTGLSCYRQLFQRGHNWSYDLEEIAAHYRYYDGLMRHWHRVMSGRILEVRYESLLEDFENQVRRLLGFCGLDWEPACLDFSRNPRAVRTASAGQVRQGLNRSALERWRCYEAHLGPLLTLT